MKKLILGLLMLATSAFAGTSTSRLGLYKPDLQETGWGNAVNNNFNIIDSSVAVLNSTQTFTGEVTLSSVSANTFRVNKIYVATPTYASSSENLAVNGNAKFFGTTGGVISMCDQNGTNCTNLNLETASPSKGIVVSTMSFNKIDFPNRQTSVFIGNGVGNSYAGAATSRPSVFVGAAAGVNYPGTYVQGGVGGGITAVGYAALSSLANGKQNTAVGDTACGYLTDGSSNLCLGYGSGHGDGGSTYVAISTYSIFVGEYTGAYSSSTYLVNSVAFGPFTKVNRNNSFVMGVNPDGGYGVSPYNVGIGTDTPRATLSIVGYDQNNYSLTVSSSGDNYHLAVSTNGNVYIPTLASGECMQVGTGGLLTTTGAGCGSGSGGGASTLAVFEDSVKISSPTSIIKFDGTDFNASLVGGATAFITLGDSVTVQGITLSSITVRSIYWPDGTVQVSSPSAGGGGSGDITAVNVSGEGLTGGASSGDATITIVSTVAYTTKNQTWTAPQTHTSSVTMINNGIAPLTIRDLSVSPPNPRIQFESSSGFLGDLGYIATNSLCSDLSTVCGTGPQADLGSISIDSNGKVSMGGFSGSTVTIKSNLSVGNFTNTVQAAPLDSVVVKGGVIVGTHTANNSALRVYSQNGDTYALHLSTPGQTALMTVSTQGVVAVPTLASLDCIGTDASGNFGSGSCTGGSGGGGYAVEPATVTFQLSKGVTASTGTFTDLVVGTTVSLTGEYRLYDESALRVSVQSSSTFVGITKNSGNPPFATLVGYKAGSLASNSGTTAVGYKACGGSGGGPGDSSTCVGQEAGALLATGVNNTLLGIKAGSVMTDGSNNVCVGDVSCNYVTSGAENTNVGNFAYSQTATNGQNVLIGFQSQVGNGSRNTCVGTYSCGLAINQPDNIAIGYTATIGAGATKAIAIGKNATATESNTMKIGGEGTDSVKVLVSSMVTSGWTVTRGSATFVSSMTLSGGYLVQNIPPSSGQVLKFDGTNWAPGTDTTGGGGGTTIWVQQDDSDIDVSVSTIDVRSPLAATSSPSGEVNLDVDKSSFTLRGPDPALGGALGGTVSNATVDDDGHNHTGTTLSGIDISDDTNLAASQPLVLSGDTVFLSTNVYVSKMGVSWDGGGSVLTTGTTYWFPIPSSGTITGFTLTGLPSGSVSINVSSSSIFNTGAVGICASACPTLSPGTSQRDTTLTGWSKTLAKDGFLYFVINSAGTSTQANLALEWIRL